VSSCAAPGWASWSTPSLGPSGGPPVKRRRRVSGSELVMSLAESQLVGGECFDDIEQLWTDAAGAALRAVAHVPATATALQLAKRLRLSMPGRRARPRPGALASGSTVASLNRSRSTWTRRCSRATGAASRARRASGFLFQSRNQERERSTVLLELRVSNSLGGRSPSDSCRRASLNQATYSTIASSSCDRVLQTRSEISSVLKVSTKLSAIA
jgi:hypothetical protein